MFDLFLDESGTFQTPAATPSQKGKEKRFPSQLAGVLVPTGELTTTLAEQILDKCHAEAGLQMKETVHAAQEVGKTNDAVSFGRYNKRIGSLLGQLRDLGWNPVRLVNREGVDFGGKPQTYTNMVAELFVKICKQKRKEGLNRIGIRLFCAEVQVVDGPRKFRLKSDVYKWRIQERKALIAIRQGYASESSNWDLVSLEVIDARIDKRLQICDLLSHASHDNFSWCVKRTTKPLFEQTLGAYNWTLLVHEWLERADQLIADRSLGLALITLTERFIQNDLNESSRLEAQRYLDRVLTDLTEMEAAVRDSQLSIILSWLEQLISLQRSTTLGYKLAKWLQDEVASRLCEALARVGRASEIDWFAFALHLWALTACNHRGVLLLSRQESEKLDELNCRLAGRWEHSRLLMEGLVAQAVHLTDSFNFDLASARMELVAQHYGHLSGLYSRVFPDVFPEHIHSDLRGKALGTWMQSEALAGTLDNARLAKARQLNEEAINEFSTSDDKKRQYQYRCHLEILAGDFVSAREFLALSLGLDEPSHEAIAAAIAALIDEPSAQGFALTHWLHLGARTLIGGHFDSARFSTALSNSGLLNSRWCLGQVPDYPAHSIFRRIAAIHAVQKETARAVTVIEALNRLDPLGQQQLIVGVIQLAAITEVAGLLWEHDNVVAQDLLKSTTAHTTCAAQLLKQLEDQTGEIFPFLARTLSRWDSVLVEIQTAGSAAEIRTRLLNLGQLVCY